MKMQCLAALQLFSGFHHLQCCLMSHYNLYIWSIFVLESDYNQEYSVLQYFKLPSTNNELLIFQCWCVIWRLTLPDDANIYGNVHGGTILKLIEDAGTIIATRYCNCAASQTEVYLSDLSFIIIFCHSWITVVLYSACCLETVKVNCWHHHHHHYHHYVSWSWTVKAKYKLLQTSRSCVIFTASPILRPVHSMMLSNHCLDWSSEIAAMDTGLWFNNKEFRKYRNNDNINNNNNLGNERFGSVCQFPILFDECLTLSVLALTTVF